MARQRPQGGLTPLPASSRWAAAPALVVLGLLVGAGLGYALAQSLGGLPLAGERDWGLSAYRQLFDGAAAGDLWQSALFTLWVSVAATVVAVGVALALLVWLERPRRAGRAINALVHINLAVPHAVWAVALLLLISQSGIVARIATVVGLIDQPADMPALVRDRFGLGIILHYATKEAPFLTLVGLALLRSQPREHGLVADTFGAHGLRRLRVFILPTIWPGLVVASGFVFAFVFGAFEAPATLGVSSPRMLSVLGLDLFNAAGLDARPAAMALGIVMSVMVAAVAWGATRLIVSFTR